MPDAAVGQAARSRRSRRTPKGVNPDDRIALALLGIVLVGVVVSGIQPHDRRVWLLEVLPWLALLGMVVVLDRRYRMTSLSHFAIAALCLIFLFGAHYTYSRVPFGLWLRDELDLQRNPYDRIAHFMGGFVGGILLREVLLRRTRLVRQWRTFALVSMVVLALAAVYEILEWWIALATRQEASEFLAHQGDEWDTQWDMVLAVLGASLAQLIFARMHDSQMRARGLKREL